MKGQVEQFANANKCLQQKLIEAESNKDNIIEEKIRSLMGNEPSDDDIKQAIYYILRRKELKMAGKFDDKIDWNNPNMYNKLYI